MLARTAYSCLYGLLLPLIVLRLVWRGHSAGLAERFGRLTLATSQPVIWVHAVSVGETIAAAPLIKALQQRHPDHQILVTNTTATGAARTRALFGESVLHAYNPYDLGVFVRAFLNKVQPVLCIVMETELWPNMLNQCHQRGIPVVIANARLSAKSAMGYQKFAALSRHMLHDVHTVAAQNAQDGERFTRLGLAEDKLAITGSIKFDVTLDDDLMARAEALHDQLSQQGKHPLWIAASTHKGEDDTLLLAHQRVRQRYPDIRLLLVPRHPERFDNVYQLAADTGLNVIRRSAASIPADWDIMIGDTMGELLLLLGAADIAFIGGSLVPNGGHNMLEAAVWSKPVITGPHLFNFQEISDLLVNASGMVVIEDGKALAGQITAWLDEPAKRQQAGEAAVAIVDTNRGALDKLLQCIDAALH
ncbi:MAG: hypothetical protein RL336_1981 [Pseudomonadota bacterium]